LEFKAREFANAMRESNAILTSPSRRQGNVTKEELSTSFADMETARKGNFQAMAKTVKSVMALGLSMQEAKKILKDNGVSEQQAMDLIRNIYRPWRMNQATTTIPRGRQFDVRQAQAENR